VRFCWRVLLVWALAGSVAGARTPTILVSIDGCRWDYPELQEATWLQQLATHGARVERLAPSFPSKTFPNHYTLVTGLRPEEHGIIQNQFYDETFQAWFGIGAHPAAREGRWWGGEPIWGTLERQHGIAASLFWPGAEADINGHQPRHWHRYDGAMPYADRIARVLAWRQLPEADRPDFIALYFEGVDSAGHDFGPEGPETKAALHEVEAALQALQTGLEALGQWDTVNLIVTADHGMTATSPTRVVDLRTLIDLTGINVVFSGALVGLDLPDNANALDLVTTLNAANTPLRAYRREDVPARLHFSHNPRIPDVVILPDLGWTVRTHAGKQDASATTGDHGYDGAERDMAALFIAHGPDFTAGRRMTNVDNIHVYNLLCAVLGVEPAPNSGDNRLVDGLLAR